MEEDPKREEEKRQHKSTDHKGRTVGQQSRRKKAPAKTASIDRRQGTQRQRKPNGITGQLFAKYILSE